MESKEQLGPLMRAKTVDTSKMDVVKLQTADTLKESSDSNLGVDDPMKVLSNDYQNIVELGSGTFGQVFKATHKATNIEVAIKLLQNCFR